MNNKEISALSDGEFNQITKQIWDDSCINPANAAIILDKVAECLEHFNINFWLVYGTALGFYRDGIFIPWDDDIDLHVEHAPFLKNFYELENLMIEKGLIVRSKHRVLAFALSRERVI